VVDPGQPQPTFSQHHACCSRPQSCCHEPKQSYFKGPFSNAWSAASRPASARGEVVLPCVDDTSWSCLSSSVARLRTNFGLARCSAASGATGSVAGCSAGAVVHPAPPSEAQQHHRFFSSDHSRCQYRTPEEQLNKGDGVVEAGAPVVEVRLVDEADASSERGAACDDFWHATPFCSQHHDLCSIDHPPSQSPSQCINPTVQS